MVFGADIAGKQALLAIHFIKTKQALLLSMGSQMPLPAIHLKLI